MPKLWRLDMANSFFKQNYHNVRLYLHHHSSGVVVITVNGLTLRLLCNNDKRRRHYDMITVANKTILIELVWKKDGSCVAKEVVRNKQKLLKDNEPKMIVG